MTRSNTKPSHESVPKVEVVEKRQDLERVMAISGHRQRASTAGKMMAIFRNSIDQKYMTFQQFQKPSKRNAIRKVNGLEPMVTPFDPVRSKGRKPARASMH